MFARVPQEGGREGWGDHLWLCCYVAMWLYGDVAMRLCGYQSLKISICQKSEMSKVPRIKHSQILEIPN